MFSCAVLFILEPLYLRRTVPDWKISTKAVATEDEEECSEFTSMPSRSSSGMIEAISIKPNSLDIDVNFFDGHDLGFFGDVGAKTVHRPTSKCLCAAIYHVQCVSLTSFYLILK